MSLHVTVLATRVHVKQEYFLDEEVGGSNGELSSVANEQRTRYWANL